MKITEKQKIFNKLSTVCYFRENRDELNKYVFWEYNDKYFIGVHLEDDSNLEVYEIPDDKLTNASSINEYISQQMGFKP